MMNSNAENQHIKCSRQIKYWYWIMVLSFFVVRWTTVKHLKLL